LLNYLSFAASASVNARRLSQFDLLYVYHPPLTIALPALWIARRRGVPFLYDVQDIWPEAGLAAGAIKRGWLYRAMASLARTVYRRASVITVIAPAFRDLLVSQGVPAAKIHVVPNWTDEQVYFPRERGDSRARYGLPAKAFIVMYAGNMGASHGVDTLLKAAGLLASDARIHFVLQGSGPEYEHLETMARERGLGNVSFQGYLPDRADIPHFLAAADVMVIHLKKSPSGAVSLPHRMLAYMACGRPMIVASEGAPRDLVQEVGCGVTCEPGQPAVLANHILELAANPERLHEMGANGRSAYQARYSEAASLARLFAAIDATAKTEAVPA
jgi:glycosyltransferase involved in cell wall biosynthesis